MMLLDVEERGWSVSKLVLQNQENKTPCHSFLSTSWSTRDTMSFMMCCERRELSCFWWRNLMDLDTQLSRSSFATKFVRGAVHQLRYPCRFHGFVKELKEQQGELIKKRNDVGDRIKTSKTQVLNMPVVHAWLERKSKSLEGNVEELLKRVETRTNKRCCCPNLIWRYRTAKKLAKKKVEVQKCFAEGDEYIRIEELVSSPDTQNVSSEKSLEFDSRKDVLEQLQKAVKDDKVYMIGLYGMGGCGKTTMAEELKKTTEAENLFNEVHFVTISNNSMLEDRSIQDKIAKTVQLPLKREEERDKRAKDLCTRLSLEHKRILLILDDVWQELDFGAIGIPYGENHKNFKVLITTRSEEVCTQMNCQEKILLSTLVDEEGWALFQKRAHISKGTPDSLKHLGRKISDECKGLPVAIAALAGTLEGKAEGDWKDALDRLQNSIPVNIEESLQNPYKCLRISYDNLETEEAKSLLLLCSVYPEDFEISVEYLTIFAIGLGLGGEVGTFEEKRNKVSAAKNKLISSCLLSPADDDDDEGKCVKMHDLVRDVAIWIASEEDKAVKCVLEKDVTLKCNSIRYLICTEFPNELDCSSVEFLCIETSSEVSDEIFNGMGRLRVLFLSWEGAGSRSLPTVSFKSLTNLRCLMLKNWELGDISFVGYMKKFEILMLDSCSFVELPAVVVTQLTNLRLLYVEECSMKTNLFEVIGKHPQLEELYFYDEGSERGDEELVKMFIVPKELRRYQIKVGSRFSYSVDNGFLKGHRALVLDCFDTSNAALMELAKKAEVLYVANILGGGKNLIPDVFQIEGGRVINYGWIKLRLCDSKEIECLVDCSNHSREVGILFSELRKLEIQRMEHLGALYQGVPPNGLFQKLVKLSIDHCPMLTCLFTPSIARSLVRLEVLWIKSCDGLKHVVAEDDLEDEEEISRQDHRLLFSKLKTIFIEECMKLEYIFPITLAEGLEQLESLRIKKCSELKYAFEQRTRGDHILHELNIELPALETLILYDNSKMISIFPRRISAMCPSLSYCNLERCPEFDILSVNNFKDVSKIGQLASIVLKYLDLHDLDQMKYICVGLKNSLTFQNLVEVQITRCEKLVVVFPASVLRSLPALQCLRICECQELKQIIEEDDVENQKLSQPCFPKLSVLVIQQCDNLKRLFYVSTSKDLPNLEYLCIVGDSKLEELIGCEQGHGDERGKVKAELATLKILVLAHLSNLCQGIELPTLTLCVVHDCPKLSLTSSFATLEEFDKQLELCGDKGYYYLKDLVHNIAKEVIESRHVFTPEDIGVEYLEGSTIQKLLGEVKSTNEVSQSIEEDKIKESVQDVPISEDAAKSAMAAGTEGNGLLVVAVTRTETGTSQNQVMQNVDDSIQEGPNSVDKEDTSSSCSSIVAELEAFKHSADLDDAQIVLLSEAIAVYPHLWKGLGKFSMRFKALMLKTLADMLFFLRNESAANITPQQENEFLSLCDEAEHGFDKSWVDEMRKRVMVSDLLKMHNQLTQELCKIKEKIEKKCFDFL